MRLSPCFKPDLPANPLVIWNRQFICSYSKHEYMIIRLIDQFKKHFTELFSTSEQTRHGSFWKGSLCIHATCINTWLDWLIYFWFILIALFSTSEQTYCALLHETQMSGCSFTQCFKYPTKWYMYVLAVLFGCYMAGATWNCCHLGAHSVYSHAPVYSVTLFKATNIGCMCV